MKCLRVDKIVARLRICYLKLRHPSEERSSKHGSRRVARFAAGRSKRRVRTLFHSKLMYLNSVLALNKGSMFNVEGECGTKQLTAYGSEIDNGSRNSLKRRWVD